MQYVSKLLGQPLPQLGVEEGYGSMIVEMGIVAPFLWVLWTAVLLYQSWKVVSRLRGTRFFPIAFAILWYAFLLLFPFTYAGLAPYQNYVDNAYLGFSSESSSVYQTFWRRHRQWHLLATQSGAAGSSSKEKHYMCGIAGIASRKMASELVASTERMVAAIAHRGPTATAFEMWAVACSETRGSQLWT